MSEAKPMSENELQKIKRAIADVDEMVGYRSSIGNDLLDHISAIEAELAAAKAECERLRVALRQIIAASETHVGRNGSYYAGESDGLRTAAYIAGQALSQEERQ